MATQRTEAAIKNDLKGLGCYLENIVKQTPSTADVLAAFCYAETTIAKAIYNTYTYGTVSLQKQYALVTITQAQANASYATPVTLLAAPGANKMILVDKSITTYKATSSTAVTATGVSSLDCNGVTVGSTIALSGLTASTAFARTGQTVSTSGQQNQPLKFKTATANPTITGTIEVYIEYFVLDLS